MVYKRNDVVISVEQVDGFGKYPSLWIGSTNPNQMVKVAGFGNKEKAKAFCKWFEYITKINDNRKEVKING